MTAPEARVELACDGCGRAIGALGDVPAGLLDQITRAEAMLKDWRRVGDAWKCRECAA